ncbi:hypothetical protein BN2497_10429 [Janthinobacterium sp. CG23_2]|nr:hypothetical protein BN2497_10429 [Janthinobacterium sp. CG23_2]CUU31612.1 hypothetical protein BN3177_10429 [Janthinobacterium sp. CG23_2]
MIVLLGGICCCHADLHWWCCFAKTIVPLAYCALTWHIGEEVRWDIKTWIAPSSGMATCINDKINEHCMTIACGLR